LAKVKLLINIIIIIMATINWQAALSFDFVHVHVLSIEFDNL